MKKLIEANNFQLKGFCRITATLKGTRKFHQGKMIESGAIVSVKEFPNLIVTVGKGLVADMLIDETGFDTGLTWQAIGSDNTAPVVGDTTLTVEEARKACTSRTRSGNVATFSTFFTAGESTFDLKEAGIFGHSTASVTPDSGVLFAHWLAAFDNTGGLYDLTYDYVLTIG